MMQRGYEALDERIERRRALLAQAPALRGCSTGALDDLARRVSVRLRPAGALVVAQDEPADGLFFIASGMVRVVLFGETGREITVAQLGPGGCFGETAILDGRLPAASVVATSDVSLLMLTRESFLAHALAYPTTAINLAAELCGQLSAAYQSMVELALDTVEQRLVRTLARWGRTHGAVDCAEGLLLPSRPTHQELAQMVGASRETITRTFSSLTKRQLLTVRGAGLLLRQALFDR